MFLDTDRVSSDSYIPTKSYKNGIFSDLSYKVLYIEQIPIFPYILSLFHEKFKNYLKKLINV